MLGVRQPAPPDAEDNCGSYQPLLDGEPEEAPAASTSRSAYAFTIPAAQGPAVRDGAGAALPALPDAAQLWRRESFLVKLWFSVSVVTLVSSLFWLELGLVAGLTGVAGASLTLCTRCRRHEHSTVETLSTTRLLALINASVSGATAAALLYILCLHPCEDQEADGLPSDAAVCRRMIVTLLIVAAWHSLNAALAARVVLRVSHVYKALNPVSSGLVAIA
ncbi:hypothetical protein WJX81_006958 [Elliptochloris bilobata]|uniref:Uncharacterized protein n=1 Tax=Elliptochloris bilobata TaxID=381761 RepID=A0AAW1SLG6_9CHLO